MTQPWESPDKPRGTLYLRTVSGEIFALRPPDNAKGKTYVLALIHCQPQWADLAELRQGIIPPRKDWKDGYFEHGPVLYVGFPGKEPVALPPPYDCADRIFLFTAGKDAPEWRPLEESGPKGRAQ